MGVFDDLEALDAALFVDPSLMPGVETVLFTPYGSTAREIGANVNRNPPSLIDGAKTIAAGMIEVFIRNHATLGATSINRDGDKISVAPRKGGNRVPMQIVEIVSQDAGGWVLRLRGRSA